MENILVDNIHISGLSLPEKPRRVLKEVLRSAGLKSASVSSVTRTIEQQSHEIINYYKRHGAEKPKKLYGRGSGGPCIEIYEKNTEHPDIAAMVASIKGRIAIDIKRHGGQTSLRHTSNTYYTFDVRPSSIDNRTAFINAVKQHKEIVRFLYPGSHPPDEAYHIEIPKH